MLTFQVMEHKAVSNTHTNTIRNYVYAYTHKSICFHVVFSCDDFQMDSCWMPFFYSFLFPTRANLALGMLACAKQKNMLTVIKKSYADLPKHSFE